jgi:hypothetical protein
MSFFPNAVIQIERKTSSSYSKLGESNSSYGIIKENLNVQIIKKELSEDTHQIYYTEEGQVAAPLFVVTCNSYYDFRKKDKITVTKIPRNSLVSVGDFFIVVEIPYKGNLIKHVKMFAKYGIEE